jgi:Mg2+/Co2+ transporter CorB
LDDSSLGTLSGAVVILVILSAYFSGSETAMMALNGHRLRHLADQGHGGAKRASRLLERPDRLLSVILIGNNLVNFSAGSIVTLMFISMFGEAGAALAPLACTVVFLIFAEVAPKSIAAAYPEKIALPSSYILEFLQWIGYPVVWMVNGVSNRLLGLFGITSESGTDDKFTREELRTVVHHGADIDAGPQNMLLRILDLEEVTVNDIMVPRADIVGVDINDGVVDIVGQIRSSQYTRIPVYKEDIDNVIGFLHLRDAAKFLTEHELTLAAILQATTDPYFVPENTRLHVQLFNFQQAKERVALVVDEYGDIQGIVTLEDILEEIVGEFTTDLATTNIDIHPQDDGSFLIDGSTHIRLINRSLGWNLPQDGAKTMNGLITEYLETFPESNVCCRIEDYRIEIIQIGDNMIHTAKVIAPAALQNPDESP